MSRLTRTAVVKLQRGQHRFGGIQQFALNPEVTEGAEIWVHCVPGTQKRLELALQPNHQSMVVRPVLHLVTSNQQAQVEGELLDGITDTLQPLLANRVLRDPIRRARTTTHG